MTVPDRQFSVHGPGGTPPIPQNPLESMMLHVSEENCLLLASPLLCSGVSSLVNRRSCYEVQRIEKIVASVCSRLGRVERLWKSEVRG